jgi:putative transposase
MANQELYEQIEFKASKETYGSPRIHRELNKRGVACSENRVARLMRLRGLKAKQSKRFKTTTRRNEKHPVAPNLLRRDIE